MSDKISPLISNIISIANENCYWMITCARMVMSRIDSPNGNTILFSTRSWKFSIVFSMSIMLPLLFSQWIRIRTSFWATLASISGNGWSNCSWSEEEEDDRKVPSSKNTLDFFTRIMDSICLVASFSSLSFLICSWSCFKREIASSRTVILSAWKNKMLDYLKINWQ